MSDTLSQPKPIRVIVCRVGRLPCVERGGTLDGMQAIVGGYVEVIALADGVDVWCNEDAMGLGLPLNRIFLTEGKPTPPGFEDAFVIDMTDGGRPSPGEPAEWRIHGDFFMARHDKDGNTISVTDKDAADYLRLFDESDTRIAREINAHRSQK